MAVDIAQLNAQQIVALAALAFLLGLFVLAAVSDIATMTIPNWISIVAACGYPPIALMMGLAPAEIGMHVACGAMIFVIGFFLFNLGVLGGGDVKVFAAAGVWTGFVGLLPFLTVTFIAGGFLAATILLLRRLIAPAPHRPAFLNRLTDRARGVPYGVAIAVGALVTAARWPISAQIVA